MLSSQVKFSADRRTDRQMDTVKQYAPDLSMRGIKMLCISMCATKYLLVQISCSLMSLSIIFPLSFSKTKVSVSLNVYFCVTM